MPIRKTHAEFEAQLELVHNGRLRVNERYVNDRTHVQFTCTDGHVWRAAPTSIIQGRGCPRCGKLSMAKKKRVSEDRIRARLFAAHGNAVQLASGTAGAFERATFQCSEGHRWMARPSYVIGKTPRGCPICHYVKLGERNRRNVDDVHREIFGVHGDAVRMIGVYLGGWKKTKFGCVNGCEWEAKPLNVTRQRSGCPFCAPPRGFDRAAPGKAYYARVQAPQSWLYKIGVTNEQRVIERFRFSADRRLISLLREWRFELGVDAWKFERKILSDHRGDRYRGPAVLRGAGNTELFVRDVLGLDQAA